MTNFLNFEKDELKELRREHPAQYDAIMKEFDAKQKDALENLTCK